MGEFAVFNMYLRRRGMLARQVFTAGSWYSRRSREYGVCNSGSVHVEKIHEEGEVPVVETAEQIREQLG